MVRNANKKEICNIQMKHYPKLCDKDLAKIYSKAMFKINCQNHKKSEIVQKIIDIYEAN